MGQLFHSRRDGCRERDRVIPSELRTTVGRAPELLFRDALVSTSKMQCLYSEAMGDRNARTVYSTGSGSICAKCGWPTRDCKCSSQFARDQPVPPRIVAKLRVEKAGRGGKTVTVVYDLPNNHAFLTDLAN